MAIAPEFYALAALAVLLLGCATAWLRRAPIRQRNAERHFRAIFDHAMLGMARTGIDKQWIEVNPALCQMLGYSAEALIGRTWAELTHPDDLTENEALFDAVIRGETEGYELEKRFLRPDGSIVHTYISARGIRMANGAVDSFSVVIEDITQRRETERQLARQVERSRVLLELPVKAEQLAEREFMQYALEQAELLTGSSIGFLHFINDDRESIELVAWSHNTLDKYCTAAFDCHYPLTKAGIWADAARTKGPVIINDYASARSKRGLPDGHSALTRLLSVPVTEAGTVRMMTGVGNKATLYTAFDVETVQLIGNETWRIVRRQRSELALLQATQVVNASPVVCFRWAASEGWPVVFVSDNVRQWGYATEDLKAGHPPFAELVHPDDLARVASEVARHTAAGVAGYEQEYRLMTAENQVIWVVDRTRVLRNPDGSAAFYDGVLTDITDRKQNQLKIAENLFQQQKLNKRLEEANNQLLQSEKMASIGQLAAGVAHELNNPIGFVHSNLGTLDGYLHDLMDIIDTYERVIHAPGSDFPLAPTLEQVKEERDFAFLKSDIFDLVAESKDGLGRVRKIVEDLKGFSHVGEQEWQEADLHQGLDSTLNIVWNELKYKSRVIKDYGDIPPVHCLISQLNQVFMNLLVNAGHAIETEGTITIRTRRAGDDGVLVEISDTGKGIPPENISRIFEPFFTTKPVGKGTGLGLSLAYGIVQRHRGRIEVDSNPGQGTTFRIVLPIRQPVEVTEAAATGDQMPGVPAGQRSADLPGVGRL